LSSSLANAKDVGDWIGANSNGIFNFATDVRSVPVDIHIHGFDASHFASRMTAMAKPAFNSLVSYSTGKPAIIFVPSRKQAQLTAIDLMATASALSQAERFVLRPEAVHEVNEIISQVSEQTLAQTLAKGVAFLHLALSNGDRDRVTYLYRLGWIGALVVPQNMCWSIPGAAHLVLIMDTVYYEGSEHRYVDYSINDILQMIGCASRQLVDDSGKAIIFCQAPKKDYLKKLLHDPIPLESHLDQMLHDHICAEVVSRTIENKQDAVDYLTWTFLYRRLLQNPNYYHLHGTTHRHLSDYLSELVETIITELEESKCLIVEDDFDLSPLNLGMIASYYYIHYTTVELFVSSLTAKTKIKGILEILSAATEFSNIPIRHREDSFLRELCKHLPQSLPQNAKFDDPATKALILMLCHFSRQSLPVDLHADLKFILSHIIKLIQALVDVTSSQGWLKPALLAMELSQMVVQGVWERDSPLLQIPHFTPAMIERCRVHSPSVASVFDVLELEDEVRDGLLQLPLEKMSDVAIFCNAYPNIELSFELDVDKEVCNTLSF
jgi:pre-mRNA-splicing helicase BRR2